MNKMFLAVPLFVMGVLFSSTAIADDKERYEEGSGGSAMEMDHKADGMEHSKEYYEKKYGKYDHEEKEMMEEGSGMKDDAMKMKEMEHRRMEEGSGMKDGAMKMKDGKM